MASGSDVANGASGIPGDLPEYLSLSFTSGALWRLTFGSLAARGISMENYNKTEQKKDEIKSEALDEGCSKPNSFMTSENQNKPMGGLGRRRRLSGAQRRRLKRTREMREWAKMNQLEVHVLSDIGNGSTFEQSYGPTNYTASFERGNVFSEPSGCKRRRNYSRERLFESHNPKRWAPNNRDVISTQQDDKSLMCAVVDGDYPIVHLTFEHLTVFKVGVAREIHEIPAGGFVPRFHDSFHEDGAIIAHCADPQSKKWLEELIPRLYPRKENPIRVVAIETVTKLHRASVWVPGLADETEILLELLERQNPGLVTSRWKFHVDQEVTDEGKTLVLDIDNESIRVLRSINFKPFLGVERVSFVLSRISDKESFL